MAIADKALPYGLREVEIALLDAAGAPGTWVKLPVAQTFSFSEEEEFEELRGDDTVAAVHGKGAQVSWDLESGGISLAAYKVLAGGTTVSSGTTPNAKVEFTKLGSDSRPYFAVRGRAISDSGGDFVARVFKCKATDSLEGELSDGSFWVSQASGTGIPDKDDKLYTLTHNETAAAFA